ncbi:hypothetical protein AVEN_87384-1 [Araneus ventricosus]|uniref:Uncharacterized protein n=1 Tax=Araneus ventricosus TaxID=182803 RepID=A0A4Y2IDF3_ARAVE|nr:hypothetical protein AVEN_87384-1 [Araneus ventricosus]
MLNHNDAENREISLSLFNKHLLSLRNLLPAMLEPCQSMVLFYTACSIRSIIETHRSISHVPLSAFSPFLQEDRLPQPAALIERASDVILQRSTSDAYHRQQARKWRYVTKPP